MPIPAPLDLQLQPKQYAAFSTFATELLYGGAAFGGKSHFIRVASITWCTEIPGLQVYIFRRIEDDLIKNHMEGPHGFRALLADWVEKKLVRITETTIHFLFNNSKIFLCHCKDEKHRYKYHGAEIHVLIMDELTTFTELIYRYLRFRTRMVGVKLNDDGSYKDTFPKKYRKGELGPDGVTVNPTDLFPRVVCGSNPGNIGHHWVKRTFIDAAPPMQAWQVEDVAEGGMIRQYIPAKMNDNPIGMAEDPDYRNRTRGLGDPMLVKAMEDGDWNVLAGGFFPEFSKARHVVKPFDVPRDWRRFTATDWGSYRPFSTGWYAIAQDDLRVKGTMGNTITIPRGSLIRYREWYGMKPGQKDPNIGMKLPVEEWAAGVLKRSEGEKIEHHVADTQMWAEDGGPSQAERAMKVERKGVKMSMRQADKQRVTGWDQLRYRLQGDITGWGEGEIPLEYSPPYLFLFDTCKHAIRTLEGLQHDETKPEDADTDGEDHAPDEIRYACMSRPKKRPEPEQLQKGPAPWSMDWIAQESYLKNFPAHRVKRPSYRME
jgi:hypothetical protein